ncbi:MAG: hypothetical protein QOI55_144 [Actinomycetota bacterium]|nr:hypothetical protein [Actinomycetota bacterium]
MSTVTTATRVRVDAPAEPEGRGPSRVWLYATLGAAAVYHAVFVARTRVRFNGTLHFTLFDDAMISMRYARNLAHGHGLVWNPGEHPVEGITNPLWTAWMAVLHLLPVPEAKMSLLVCATASLLLLGNIAVVWAIANRIAPGSRIVAPAAAVLTAQSYALTFWALRGMEIGLLAFSIDVAVLAALRIRDRAAGRNVAVLGFALGAAVLTRQDALLPAAIVGAYAFVAAPADAKRRVAVAVGAALVGTSLGLTLFRVAYYGDALPNTYYLKMTGVSISERIHRGWVALRQLGPHQLAPVAAVAVLAYTGARRRQLELYALGTMCVAQTAYSVFVGGDAWENEPFANRYLAVMLPALFILAAVGVEAVVEANRRGAAARLAAASALTGTMLLWFAWLRSHHEVLFRGAAEDGGPAAVVGVVLVVAAAALALLAVSARSTPIRRRAAPRALPIVLVAAVAVVAGYIPARVWLRSGASLARADALVAAQGEVEAHTTERDTRIAVWWAGNGPYFSHRPSIDVLGKSDRRVAHERPSLLFRPGHNKLDLEYSVHQLRPDVIDLGYFIAPDPGDERLFTRWGYDQVVQGVFVRRDTHRVDRRGLAAGILRVRHEFGP